MKKLAALLISGLLLSGCAIQQKERGPLPVVTVENQQCFGDECELLWANVPEKLEMITGMRVDTVSSSYIATYPPTRDRFLGGYVKLVPVSKNKKEIQPSFVCQRYMDDYRCSVLSIKATDAFNATMKELK